MTRSASYLAAGLLIAAMLPISMAHAASDLKMLNAIAKSHIDGNVPAPKDFDVLLKRDLTKYFSMRSRLEVSVQFQPLRTGVTQSGTAYPKFY